MFPEAQATTTPGSFSAPGRAGPHWIRGGVAKQHGGAPHFARFIFSVSLFRLNCVARQAGRKKEGKGAQEPPGRMLAVAALGWGPPTHERGNDTLTGWEI